MSNFNQRGQMDEVPMTGRRMGRCGNFGAGHRYSTQENENIENTMNDNLQEQGLGRGRGQRMRRGMRNRMGRGKGGGMGQNRGGRGLGQGNGDRGRGMGGRFRDDIQEWFLIE